MQQASRTRRAHTPSRTPDRPALIGTGRATAVDQGGPVAMHTRFAGKHMERCFRTARRRSKRAYLIGIAPR